MKKLAVFIICGVLILIGLWLWFTNQSFYDSQVQSGVVETPMTSGTAAGTNNGIRVWGSSDDQKNHDVEGYSPREIQYDNGVIRIEEDTQTPLESGYAKFIHYGQNIIRMQDVDEQMEGRGAPMASTVSVEVLDTKSGRSTSCFNSISGVAGGDGAYDVFIRDQYVISLAWVYSSTMFSNLSASVCDMTTGTKDKISGESTRIGGAIQTNLNLSVDSLTVGDQPLKAWLKNVLQEKVDAVNAMVPPPTP